MLSSGHTKREDPHRNYSALSMEKMPGIEQALSLVAEPRIGTINRACFILGKGASTWMQSIIYCFQLWNRIYFPLPGVAEHRLSFVLFSTEVTKASFPVLFNSMNI